VTNFSKPRPSWLALGLTVALAWGLAAGLPDGGAASAAASEDRDWRTYYLTDDPGKRGAARPSAKGGVIRLAAVGDILLGTAQVPPGKDIFSEVKPFLADRQVVFGNLEGPLTDRGAPTKDPSAGAYYLFRSPPAYGRLLKEAGFNILSLANNHINDYGPAGRAQTVSVLKGLGIRHTGGPGEVAGLKAGKTSLAFIGLAPNAGCQNLHDLAGAVALVRAEAAKPDTLVVVSFHGGGEGPAFMRRTSRQAEYYLGENRGNLPALAHALIDAGADLVLGHGPHVPRGLEMYKGRPIAWSLGNFATLGGLSIRGPAGLAPLLLVDLAPDGALRRVKVVGFKQEPRRGPRLDPENRAARVMAELSRGDLPKEWLAALGEAVP
jgi:hypothetical protein